MLEEISNNWLRINQQIQEVAARQSGSSIKILLVAVSKKQSLDKIKYAYQLGLRHFAENYAQELIDKKAKLSGLQCNWHFIGHLQTNKVKQVVGVADWIHSVDSLELVRKIDQQAEKLNIVQKILIQINIAQEVSKGGFSLDEFGEIAQEIYKYKNIKLCGLMVFPPLTEDKNLSQKYFRDGKIQFDKLCAFCPPGYEKPEVLSMGTSNDFISAIAEGSSLVRIGTALFGERES